MAYTLWLRHSSALGLTIAFAATVALVVSSRSGWQWQWQWAISWASGATIVIAPLLAGMTAFDVQRRVTRTTRLVVASSRRGTTGVLALVLALLTTAGAACAGGVVFVALRTASVNAHTEIPWLIIGHAGAALVAAAGFGLLVGTLVPNLAAGPLAAVACYVVPVALMPFGVEGLLAAGGATGPAFGTEPDPAVYAAMITVNLLLAAVCLVGAVGRLRPVTRRHWIAVSVGAIVWLVSLAVLSSMDPRMNALRAAGEAEICVGSGTTVCGPPDARAMLEATQGDLNAARDALAGQGLTTADSYSMVHDVPAPGSDSGVLQVEPTAISSGEASTWDLALTIATPSACPQYFGDAPPTSLLDAQAALAERVTAVLDGQQGAVIDDRARQMYAALRTCDPTALPR